MGRDSIYALGRFRTPSQSTICHEVCIQPFATSSSLTVLQLQHHWQLKAGVYVGSEIGSGDLFKSAVTKPGQEEWDDGGGGVGAKKEPKNLVEYAENYHEEILRSEAGKGFQNPTGISFLKCRGRLRSVIRVC
jgi:hypothetical protein